MKKLPFYHSNLKIRRNNHMLEITEELQKNNEDSHILRFSDESESIAFILATLVHTQSISTFANENKVAVALHDLISELMNLSHAKLLEIKNYNSHNNEYFNEYRKIVKSIRQSKAGKGVTFQNLLISISNYNKNGADIPQLIWSLDNDYHFTVAQINLLSDKLTKLSDAEITMKGLHEIADSVIDEN